MDFEAVKKYLEEQKESEEVKNYLQGLSQLTPDGVSSFLESEEGKKLVQPKLDSYFTKGLETWKSNNLKKLVDEELKKVNPPTNPLEIKLQELENQLLLKELKEKATSVLNEKKLPIELVDLVIGQDEESTLKRVEALNTSYETHLNARVQEQLKSGGITPPSGSNPDNSNTKNMSPTQLMSMAYSQTK